MIGESKTRETGEAVDDSSRKSNRGAILVIALASAALLIGGIWTVRKGAGGLSVGEAMRESELALSRGKFAEAEATILTALKDRATRSEEAVALRKGLAKLYLIEGRFDEVFPLYAANWRAAERPDSGEAIEALHAFVELELGTLPLEGLKTLLENARKQAPDDDRVLLALANHALRTGKYAEAEPLLRQCAKARPDDPAVARSRIFLALALDRDSEARRLLDRLKDDSSREALSLVLEIRRAVRQGDPALERRALLRRLETAPDDSATIDRLRVQAERRGDAAIAKTLRDRKNALDLDKRDALAAFDSGMEKNAAVLARLANRQGKRFEAEAFARLALARGERDAEVRRIAERGDNARVDADRPLIPYSNLFDPAPESVAKSAEPGLTFQDDARIAGLTFTYRNGRTPNRQVPETMGGGVALLDYDGDGFLDVYVVGGGVFPPDRRSRPQGDRLFRNQGDGTFEDATESSGIARLPRGYGHGVAVGDIDNDGDPDLFVTRWRAYALYRNKGDGTFEDATEAAGFGGDRDWPTSAAFADFDGDGDLDLYVAHYVVWDENHPQICESPSNRDKLYCGPYALTAIADHLFRNEGGRFIDATETAGIRDLDGRGLGVLAADVDDDGKIDVYVANDGSANFLFLNRGNFRFEESALAAGLAGNANGGFQGGMGLARGDIDGDGKPDMLVSNFFGESSTLYRNLGGGVYADQSSSAGLAGPTRYMVGFGVGFFDLNNDGRLDLIQTNGHVNEYNPLIYPYAMPTQLFLGGRLGRFRDATESSGAPWTTSRVGRGLAVGDLDHDGRLDAIVLPQNSPLAYFHNRDAKGGRFATFALEGARSNRDGVGAKVTVEADGKVWIGERLGGGSYQSAHGPRLHFGLGAAKSIDRVEVRWPSGRIDRYLGLAVDRGYALREGDRVARPLPGFASKTAQAQGSK